MTDAQPETPDNYLKCDHCGTHVHAIDDNYQTYGPYHDGDRIALEDYLTSEVGQLDGQAEAIRNYQDDCEVVCIPCYRKDNPKWSPYIEGMPFFVDVNPEQGTLLFRDRAVTLHQLKLWHNDEAIAMQWVGPKGTPLKGHMIIDNDAFEKLCLEFLDRRADQRKKQEGEA